MVIRKKGRQYCLYSRRSGRKLGCHPSRKKAEKQELAITLSRLRKEGRIPKRRKSSKKNHNPNSAVGAMVGGALGAYFGYKIAKRKG